MRGNSYPDAWAALDVWARSVRHLGECVDWQAIYADWTGALAGRALMIGAALPVEDDVSSLAVPPGSRRAARGLAGRIPVPDSRSARSTWARVIRKRAAQPRSDNPPS